MGGQLKIVHRIIISKSKGSGVGGREEGEDVDTHGNMIQELCEQLQF